MADDKYKPSTNVGGESGIYQFTAGTSYKAVLGGSTGATVGITTAVTAAIDNKLTVGTSNAFKASADASISFGKSFTYKSVSDTSFNKSSISISEVAGSRCLDLFQASAGLGTISRGAFEAQQKYVMTAMKVMFVCDVLTALGTLAMAGVGVGFQNQKKDESKDKTRNTVVGVTSALTGIASLIPILTAFATAWLNGQKGKTSPDKWNPTSVLQASHVNGTFIGAIGNAIGSSFIQNMSGSEWLVFKGATQEYLTRTTPWLKDPYIVGFDTSTAMSKSSINMTDSAVTFNTKQLEFEGKAGASPGVHTGTGMTALFQDVKLTASGLPDGAGPPSAELSLAGSSPSAQLIASAPGASSSVEATPTSLNLKSGTSTTLKLASTSGEISAMTAKLTGSDSVKIDALQVSVKGASQVSISGAMIRLG